MLPSFFLTNNTGAPHGETLGLMNCFSSNSSNYFFNSPNSNADIRYGAIEIGLVPGTKSIANSTSLSGGNSVMSFRKTSGNFCTIGKSTIPFSLLSFNEATSFNSKSQEPYHKLQPSEPPQPRPNEPETTCSPPLRSTHLKNETTQQVLKVIQYHPSTIRKFNEY